MLTQLALLVAITFVPALELRASIPYGYLQSSMPFGLAVAVCLLANVALAPVVWIFLDRAVHLLLRFDWIRVIYEKMVVRTQRNVEPWVNKWGVLGLGLFIGIPLPGSGVYSGALGAYLLGFRFRDFMAASVIGVLMAGGIVSLVMVSGSSAFDLLLARGAR
jgi:uncharacterized membrane protein